MDGMYSVNAGAINGLCGPDKLQKKSIARSVPRAEGAGCPFAYFSDKGKVRLADVSRVELLFIAPSMAIVAPANTVAASLRECTPTKS